MNFLQKIRSQIDQLSEETVLTLKRLDEVFRNDDISIPEDERQMAEIIKSTPEFVQNELAAIGIKLRDEDIN